MTKQPKKKAAAFILRTNLAGRREILLHSFETNQNLSLRLPGGGIDEGETVADGLLRELHEETGFSNWTLARKLGIQSYFKPYINADVERHDFLLWAEPNIPSSWKNVVHGTGEDSGDLFGFQWLGSQALENIDEEHRPFINRTYIPELFENDL